MKRADTILTIGMFVLALIAAVAHPAAAQEQLGSEFTYQGLLKLSSDPLNDSADFEFTLFDADVDGNMIGSTVAVDDVTVVDGLFTVEVDFGVEAFNGDNRWLRIAVRSPAGGGEFTTLDPWQPLTATPYSLQTRGIFVDDDGNVGIGTTNPSSKLNVHGTTKLNGDVLVNGQLDVTAIAQLGGDVRLQEFGGTGTAFLQARDGSNRDIALRIRTQKAGTEVEAVHIDADGNVGVGTTDPGATLDVNGTAMATAFVGDGSGLTNLPGSMWIRYGGGVELLTQPTLLDQEYAVHPLVTSAEQDWRSFTAGMSGDLAAIEVFRSIVEGDPGASAVVNLYDGEGTGGTLLATSSIPESTGNVWQPASFRPAVPIVAGNQYTIELSASSQLWWGVDIAGTYSGGRAGSSPTWDYAFRSYVLDPSAEFVSALSIDAVAGNVGLGRNPDRHRLEVSGFASKSTAGDWLANSDRRIKQNVETVSNALDTLKKVRLVSFEYTDAYRAKHPGVGEGRYLSVIAQEFAEVFPDHVQGSGELLPGGSEILQVDTWPLTIYSAAAVQELRANTDLRLAEKDAEIEALRRKNAELESRLARIEALVAPTNVAAR